MAVRAVKIPWSSYQDLGLSPLGLPLLDILSTLVFREPWPLASWRDCGVQGTKDQQGLSWTDPPAANQFDKNQEDMGAEGLLLAVLANRRVHDVTGC